MEQVGKGTPDVVGVDGCKAGWFAVRLFGQRRYQTCVFETFGELVSYYVDADLILVDMPIGLSEDVEPRECDRKARKLVGSSVFRSPTRQAAYQVLKAPNNYRAACKVEHEVAKTPKGMSKQAFYISAKVAEVDHTLRARGAKATPVVREIHPEVCFWALNAEREMTFSKKPGKRGFVERLPVLQRIEPRTDAIVAAAASKFLRQQVGWDDILDALAAAVTGYYGYHALQTLPPSPCHDAKGLPMEMVYWVPPAMQ